MSLYLVQFTKRTVQVPTGLLDDQGEPVTRAVTVPDLGAGVYVPIADESSEPQRLQVYLDGERDPLFVRGPFPVGNSPTQSWYMVHGARGDARGLLEDLSHVPERAADAIRNRAGVRDALKVAGLRPLRNSSGEPVALLPDWCVPGKSPRALAAGGEDPDEMTPIPELDG